MKVVFMGTSDFAVPSLAKLIDSHYRIMGVVTQPDRPKGRGKKLMPSPIKDLAIQHDLEVFQPERINVEKANDALRHWEADLIIVVSYGQILPPEILDVPLLGCINVHASLLPHYRGAAPIQRAIMAGAEFTGVTTMLMDAGLDTGDIILQKPVEIDAEMDHGALEKCLAAAGADLLMDTLAVLASGSFPRRKQDNHRSSYAPKLTREEEKIDWQDSAVNIRNRIRALSPQPAAYTSYKDNRFKIFKSRVVNREATGAAGQIMAITPQGFQVITGQGILEVLEVQKQGKNRILSSEFLKGFTLVPGDILT